jgi:hypothetical protein
MNYIAIIDTNAIIFFKEENNSIELITTEHLYFYYDSVTKQINNHEKYKIFVIENNQFAFADIIEKISNNQTITLDNRSLSFDFFISIIFEKIIPPQSSLEIIFSDNINSNAQQKIAQALNNKFSLTTLNETISFYIAKYHILKNQITTDYSAKIISTNYNITTIANAKFSDNTLYINNVSKILSPTLSPETFAIAQTIIDDLERVYKKNISDQNSIIEYLSLKIENKKHQIYNFPQDFFVISTRLPESQERFTIRIDKNKLKIQQQIFFKNYIAEINKTAQIPENENIIVCGDFFSNNIKIFNSFFDNIDNYNYSEILSFRNNELSQSNDEFSTMFMTNEEVTEAPQKEQTNIISTLNINNLDVGDKVKLTNYDPRPNKGYSTQLIEYLANNRFVVIESTRSLRTGDILETKEQVWHAGIKLIFDVFRNGKLYGRFQTREIQTIEIISEKK